jgi:hypothetical protein
MFEPEDAHDPFPLRGKIGTHRNSHPSGTRLGSSTYLKRHGLPVPDDIEFNLVR